MSIVKTNVSPFFETCLACGFYSESITRLLKQASLLLPWWGRKHFAFHLFSKESWKCAKMFSMEKFNAWLLQELSKRNWSQSDLSYRANISRGTLSNILSGSRKIGTDVILAIARALHLPPEAVFRAAGILPPTPRLPGGWLAGVISENQKYAKSMYRGGLPSSTRDWYLLMSMPIIFLPHPFS